MSDKAVVILSGGLDSSTLLHYVVKTMGQDVVAVTIDYGQTHRREIEAARAQVRAVRDSTKRQVDHIELDLRALSHKAFRSALTGVGDVPNLDDVVGHPQPPTYVPFRNLIFLTIAAGIAESQGASMVYFGAQSADLYGYWDTTTEFLSALNQVFSLNRGTQILIEAPFLMMKKQDIVRLGEKLGVDYRKTWSCYRGGDTPCLECATCRERLIAFERAGFTDPLLETNQKET